MTTPTSNGRVAAVTEAVIGAPAAHNPEDLRLALRAATLYYLDGLTQAEIATRLGVSRPDCGPAHRAGQGQGPRAHRSGGTPHAAGQLARG